MSRESRPSDARGTWKTAASNDLCLHFSSPSLFPRLIPRPPLRFRYSRVVRDIIGIRAARKQIRATSNYGILRDRGNYPRKLNGTYTRARRYICVHHTLASSFITKHSVRRVERDSISRITFHAAKIVRGWTTRMAVCSEEISINCVGRSSRAP